MDKPCDSCTTNIEQAITAEEIACFKTCKDWKGWNAKRDREKKGEGG